MNGLAHTTCVETRVREGTGTIEQINSTKYCEILNSARTKQ
jgi:hypothetical protein